MNDIVSLIPTSACLSFVYRKAIALCFSFVINFAECIFHYNGLMVEYLGSFIYRIMAFANKDYLTSFFLVIPLLSPLFVLNAFANASSTLLNRAGRVDSYVFS